MKARLMEVFGLPDGMKWSEAGKKYDRKVEEAAHASESGQGGCDCEESTRSTCASQRLMQGKAS